MIPRRVHLFWSDPRQGQAPLPDDVAHNVHAWRRTFPDFEVTVWMRDELRELLVDFHGSPASDALRICRFPNVQSDIARLALLYSRRPARGRS